MLPYDRFGRARVAQRTGCNLYVNTNSGSLIQNLNVVNNISYPVIAAGGSATVAALGAQSGGAVNASVNTNSWTEGTETYTLSTAFSFIATTVNSILAVTVTMPTGPETVVVELQSVNHGSGGLIDLKVAAESQVTTIASTATFPHTFTGTLNITLSLSAQTLVVTVPEFSFSSTQTFAAMNLQAPAPGAQTLNPAIHVLTSGLVTATTGATSIKSSTGPTLGSVYNTLMTSVTDGYIYSGTFAAPMALSANQASRPLLSGVPVASANINGYIYFVDGTNITSLNIATNTVTAYAATTGSAPTNCCLACNWRGRLVLAGDSSNPQNFYMARTGVPTDWDYSQTDPAAAVAGNLSKSGQIGEPITALIPYTDDYMIIGCTNSLWMLEGDIADGGTIVRISDQMGILGPNAWCVDPQGLLYFLAPGGLYSVKPMWEFYKPPELVSGHTYDQFFQQIDWSHNLFTMVSDFDRHYLYIFVTPANQTIAGTHLVYDIRNGGLWPIQYPQNIGPTCALLGLNDAGPASRQVFMGGFDGGIYRIGQVAQDDAGIAISSLITLGPIQPIPGEAAILQGTTIDLGETQFPGVTPITISQEQLSPPPDGIITGFQLGHNAILGSLQIYKNGMRLNGTYVTSEAASFDYLYDGNANVTFTVSPAVGDILLADYSAQNSSPTVPPDPWNAVATVNSGYDAYEVTEGVAHSFGNTSCVLERRQTTIRQRLRGAWFTLTLSNSEPEAYFSFESAVLEFTPGGRNRERR
jgi:hypothetical protein